MKPSKILFLLLTIPSTLLAQADIKQWQEIIDVARQPSVSIQEKEKTAQKVLDFLRQDFKTESKAEKSEDLYKKIALDPKKLQSLTVGKGKYVDLFTDFSRLVSQISVEKTFASCGNYKNYKESISEGNASYSPCDEGNFVQSFVLYDAKETGDVRASLHSIPNFAYSSSVSDLISVSNALTLEEKAPENPPLVSSMNEIIKSEEGKDPKAAYLTYKKMTFQDEIYNRSILNAVRNVVTLKLQYGGRDLSKKELDENIKTTVANLCMHCNPATQLEMGKRLTHIIESEKTKGNLKHRPTSEVTKSLCDKLKAQKYPFYQSYGARDMSLMSMVAGKTKAKTDHYRRERVKALTAVVQGGGEGLLILTDSVTKLDDKVTDYLKLKCNGSAADDELIRKGSEEAALKAAEYAAKLNEKMKLGLSTASIDENVRFMLRSNPRAVGEALNQNSALAPYTCTLLGSIITQDKNDELEEKAWIWGTAVVGTGLSLTGAFAPVGATLTMTAIAAGSALGVASAGHEYLSALEAKEKSELLESATFASGDTRLIAISQTEFKKYQEAKISAMINMGLNAVEVATLMKGFMAQSKNFGGAVDLLSAKAQAKALTQVEKISAKISSAKTEELKNFLQVTTGPGIPKAMNNLDKNPAHFMRDGDLDMNTLKLEVLKPGSAAGKFKRTQEWKFVGNKQPFRVPAFKAGTNPTTHEKNLREAFVNVREVLDTPEIVYKHMQSFEDEVLLECYKANPRYAKLSIDQQFEIKQTAMEKILGEEELKHGFKSTSPTEYKPLVLENKPYKLDEWFEMLKKGQAFNDSGFLPSTTKNLATKLMEVEERAGHGYYTHRIQFYVLMKEMDKNPTKFHNIQASELMKTLGDIKFNRKLGLANSAEDTLWQEIFDSFSGSYHQPEFFRQRHDDYPELGPWMMIDNKDLRII